MLFSVCSVLLSVLVLCATLKIPVTRSRTFARSESAMPDMPVGAADIPAVSAQLILARIDQTDRSVQEIIARIDTTVSTAVTAAVTAALQSIEERFTRIETKFEERVQRLEEPPNAKHERSSSSCQPSRKQIDEWARTSMACGETCTICTG